MKLLRDRPIALAALLAAAYVFVASRPIARASRTAAPATASVKAPSSVASAAPAASTASSNASSSDESNSTAPEPTTPEVAITSLRRLDDTMLDPAFAAALKKAARPLGPLEACYRDAIANEAEGDATLTMRLSIAPPGRVTHASPRTSAFASSRLRRCARNAFVSKPPLRVPSTAAKSFDVEVAIEMRRDASRSRSSDTPAETSVRAPSACAETCDARVDDSLRAELRARAESAVSCLTRGAAENEPTTLRAGEIALDVRVAEDGSVCGVDVARDDFKRPSAVTCLEESFSRAFASKPNGCAIVRVPIAVRGR